VLEREARRSPHHACRRDIVACETLKDRATSASASPLARRWKASCRWCGVSAAGRPKRTPRALRRLKRAERRAQADINREHAANPDDRTKCVYSESERGHEPTPPVLGTIKRYHSGYTLGDASRGQAGAQRVRASSSQWPLMGQRYRHRRVEFTVAVANSGAIGGHRHTANSSDVSVRHQWPNSDVAQT
jgi:hypothetical protein